MYYGHTPLKATYLAKGTSCEVLEISHHGWYTIKWSDGKVSDIHEAEKRGVIRLEDTEE